MVDKELTIGCLDCFEFTFFSSTTALPANARQIETLLYVLLKRL